MKKFSVLGVLLMVAFLLAGCGGGTPTLVPTTTLKIEMTEFSFNPARFSVPAGKQITLELKNSGAVQHDFLILKQGTLLQGKFDRATQVGDIYFDALLDPEKTQTFTFTAPSAPGDYQVICGIAGHYQSGMTASLTVVAP